MSKKSTKELAFIRERQNLHHKINLLTVENLSINKQLTEANIKINEYELTIKQQLEIINRLKELLCLSEDELKVLIESTIKKNEMMKIMEQLTKLRPIY